MNTAFLLKTHPNARYNDSLEVLTEAELTAVLGEVPLERTDVGGMIFFSFDADETRRLAVRQSPNCAGLFAVEGEKLVPLEIEKRHAVGADMAHILKYSGKTNPDFTDTMLFLAEAYAEGAAGRLLDPCCGRGTTLYAAADRGWDAYGVDTDKNDVAAGVQFTKKYFEYHRVRHKLARTNLTVDGRVGGERSLFTYGEGRELAFVRGDAGAVGSFFTKKKFDVVAADLPYGIQHGAENGALALVRRCLPAWLGVLRAGGVLILSFNTYTTDRGALAALVPPEQAEALPVSAEHWVEQAVMRDFLLVKKR